MLFRIFVASLVLYLTTCEIIGLFHLFRYGSIYPKHKTQFEPRSFQPFEYGRVTPAGKRQHFILGSQLRAKYIDYLKFLPINFDARQLYVATSNYDRTFDSAYAQLMGFYPPGTGAEIQSEHQEQLAVPPIHVHNLAEIQENLKWFSLPRRLQSWPVHYVDAIDNISISTLASCHKIVEDIMSYQSSQEYQDYITQNYDQEIRKQLCEAFQVQWEEIPFDQAIEIYEWINIYKTQGWESYIPSQITEDTYNKLGKLYTWYNFKVKCPNSYDAQLYASGLINHLFTFFDKIITKKTYKKMLIISGHGSNIVGLIKALNLLPD